MIKENKRGEKFRLYRILDNKKAADDLVDSLKTTSLIVKLVEEKEKPVKEFRAEIKGYNEDADCCTCIHAEDTLSMCQLRLCVHAIDKLYERYEENKNFEN